MHIVTFYSFKGGVGRSMALVNVAVELAKSGQRVLIVDFDLEAPGIDTFNLPRPMTTTKGVVEFVLQYLERGESPDVSEFMYRATIPVEKGELWIMPSGSSDGDYDRQFKSINWQDLYENRDGYLLFEDLKAQWNQVLQPDYVLIDSRTGHSDTSGICTRQLPDSVAIFFFPNEQNRRGLECVARQIREEEQTDRKKVIKLHFVLSNVPEVDDEEGFLAKNLAHIRETLGFDSLSATIHHYQSLALVSQSVFTLERPRTRLAQEYVQLSKVIRRDNIEDREVVLEFLEDLARNPQRRRIHADQLEERILAIKTTHVGDQEVLFNLALLLRKMRRFEEAMVLLQQAGELGASSADFYLARSELCMVLQDSDSAVKDIQSLLFSTDASYLEISAAGRLLSQRDPHAALKILRSPKFSSIETERRANFLEPLVYSTDDELVQLSSEILYEIVASSEGREGSQVHSDAISLALIREGRYQDAIDLITGKGKRTIESLGIADCFNFAMAKWGLDSVPSVPLFNRIIELDKDDPTRQTANRNQCRALALWVVNQPEGALTRLGQAWQHIAMQGISEFSCWSYRQLRTEAFLEDLKEMRQLFEGKSIEPRFIKENKTKTMATKHD